jgi:hypothetical protein
METEDVLRVVNAWWVSFSLFLEIVGKLGAGGRAFFG